VWRLRVGGCSEALRVVEVLVGAEALRLLHASPRAQATRRAPTAAAATAAAGGGATRCHRPRHCPS
jgi:hypothetical protein